jgi:hypothetical protein
LNPKLTVSYASGVMMIQAGEKRRYPQADTEKNNIKFLFPNYSCVKRRCGVSLSKRERERHLKKYATGIRPHKFMLVLKVNAIHFPPAMRLQFKIQLKM